MKFCVFIHIFFFPSVQILSIKKTCSNNFVVKLLVDYARLLVEAGFPDNLLLRENDDNENVIDMLIKLRKKFTKSVCVQHFIVYLLEEKQNAFLGPNNLDKGKKKKYRRYLQKLKVDVCTSGLHQQERLD